MATLITSIVTATTTTAATAEAPTTLGKTMKSADHSELVASDRSETTAATSGSSADTAENHEYKYACDSPGERKVATPYAYTGDHKRTEAGGNGESKLLLNRQNSGSLPDLRTAAEQPFDMSDFECGDLFQEGGEMPEQLRQPLPGVPEDGDSYNPDTPPASLNARKFSSAHAMNLVISPPLLGASPMGPSSMASSTQSNSTVQSMELHAAQPLLYSAIGSLEKIPDKKAAALFQSRYVKSNTTREFRSTDFAPLIPPTRSQQKSLMRNVSAPPVTQREPIKPRGDLKPAASAKPATKSALRKKKDRRPSAKDDMSPSKSGSGSSGNSRKRDKLRKKGKRVSISKQTEERFLPVSEAFTPREKKNIKYKPAEMRTPVQSMSTTMGTLSRPNFRDALRRVAMIIRQHIVKIEHRFENKANKAEGLFSSDMKDMFSDENFVTPTYKCTMVRIPMARPSTMYGLRKIRLDFSVPTEEEIFEFGHQLFDSVQLSSECSIVCLIYVERLMESAQVPLVASTWRPIFMCGLLLASKVWQDLASWNIEFASVYPQYSLDAINRLELQFLRMVKWDLYISSSLYAKYYFALRSLVEKQDFRQRYNRMVGGVGSVAPSEALKVQKRTELVKEEALMQLSRSM